MEGQYLASEPPGHNARARKGDSPPPPRAPPSHTQPLLPRPSPDFSSLCPPSRKQSVAKGSSTLRQRPPPAEKTQEGTNEYSPIQIFPLLRPPSAATTDRGSERGSIIQKLQHSPFFLPFPTTATSYGTRGGRNHEIPDRYRVVSSRNIFTQVSNYRCTGNAHLCPRKSRCYLGPVNT